DHRHPVNGALIYSSRPIRVGIMTPQRGRSAPRFRYVYEFECLGYPDKNPKPHRGRAAHNTINREKWSGLCDRCRVGHYFPRPDGRFLRATKDWTTEETQSVVCDSRRKGNLVPVLCG